MRHLYECPMRWADMDQLGHVNNVVYVDYLQEARVDMLRTHRGSGGTEALVEGLVVVRSEVSFLAPLVFGFEPVLIECWVTEVRAATFTVAYEIFHDAPDGGRRVYCRATTVLTPYVFTEERPRRLTAEERESLAAWHEPAADAAGAARPAVAREKEPEEEPEEDKVDHYPVRVRFSDVDVYGHVNNVKYFEYLQEARIWLTAQLWGDVPEDSPPVAMVVAQVDVDYLVPLVLRPEPYDARSWISRVGRSSMTIESEIRDGERVCARGRAVLVFFDAATQRAATPADVYRDPVLAAVTGG